ncbi:glycosyltransferase family 9 protein [Agarivorans aestuarii]|uniref:Glycosyltransferase family 9 protein n=1 Tax=Agarivorans aestuarii TaxID=1563703 RepID=A0ABU7G9T7_9ALTE|nr:glycosyltransferase family 9 protein [Agarivorans aestuarii]MEE1676025.1 glycosyltransferase family 9 protein [Agarivorans aestuarii]
MLIKDYVLGRLFQFRDKVNFILGRFLFDKPPSTAALKSVSSILFVRGDGKIGDSIVSSFLYREIKNQQPEIKLGVLCTSNSKKLFDTDPYIDSVHEYPKRPKLWQVKSLIRQLPSYDAVIFLPEVMKARDFLMLRCLKAKANIGVAKNVRLINYNISAEIAGKHSQEYFVEAARQLGFTVSNSNYRFNLPEMIEQDVMAFLGSKKGRYIAINAFGNTQKRSFSKSRLMEVLQALKKRFPEYPIVVMASPVSQSLVNTVADGIEDVFCIENTESIEQNAALIKYCKLFISVDTATVHLARCFNTPMVAIYRPDPQNFAMWQPNYQPTEVVFSRAANNPREEVNIGEFETSELLAAVSHLLEHESKVLNNENTRH